MVVIQDGLTSHRYFAPFSGSKVDVSILVYSVCNSLMDSREGGISKVTMLAAIIPNPPPVHIRSCCPTRSLRPEAAEEEEKREQSYGAKTVPSSTLLWGGPPAQK